MSYRTRLHVDAALMLASPFLFYGSPALAQAFEVGDVGYLTLHPGFYAYFVSKGAILPSGEQEVLYVELPLDASSGGRREEYRSSVRCRDKSITTLDRTVYNSSGDIDRDMNYFSSIRDIPSPGIPRAVIVDFACGEWQPTGAFRTVQEARAYLANPNAYPPVRQVTPPPSVAVAQVRPADMSPQLAQLIEAAVIQDSRGKDGRGNPVWGGRHPVPGSFERITKGRSLSYAQYDAYLVNFRLDNRGAGEIWVYVDHGNVRLIAFGNEDARNIGETPVVRPGRETGPTYCVNGRGEIVGTPFLGSC